MARGINRTGNFHNGTPINLLTHNFGNPMTAGDDPAQFGDLVTWTPDPAHFGNVFTDPIIAHIAGSDNGLLQGVVSPSPIDTTGADFIVVATTGYKIGVPELFDNKGNSWHLAESQSTDTIDGFLLNQLWYAFNAHVGTGHTFTFADGAGPGSDCAIAVAAFSGLRTSLDPFESGMASGPIVLATSVQGTALTPDSPRDLVVQALTTLGNTFDHVTMDSTFTIPDQDGLGSASGAAGAALGFIFVPSTSPLNPTWNQSSGSSKYMGCVGAAFAKA